LSPVGFYTNLNIGAAKRSVHNKVNKMSNTTKASAPKATVAPKAIAPKAAPVVTKATALQKPEPKVVPQAPLFSMGPWPAKSQGGNSVRAYCHTVAVALNKANPDGFTLAQLASAFAGGASGSTMRQPGTGWGTVAKPNGAALTHANWFAHVKQGWLSPVAKK